MATVTLQRAPGAPLTIDAELALTPSQWERGLMGRTKLLQGKGMLFVFSADQRLFFWMKDTLIPLDVLYFSADGQFVSSATMTPCTADPCATYPSRGPATYALEVPAGYAAAHQIGEGWTLHSDFDVVQ